MRGTKLLSLASAAILGMSAVPMSVSAADGVDANGRDLRYDVNLDGEVNVMDASILMYYYALNQTGSDYREDKKAISVGITDEVYTNIEANCDYNNDGFVQIQDVTFCLKYLCDTGYLFGDVNQDGVVNAVDASEILSCYANAQTTEGYYMSEEYISLLSNADVDGSLFIDADDASKVLSTYAESQTD